LVRVLDGPVVAGKPAAAKQLVETLNALSKRLQRPRRLAVGKSMTTSSPSP
jgi:uncharacterized protein YjeT (DUF2065 family)